MGMDTTLQLSVEKWPDVYATQYDALVVQPHVTTAILAQDEDSLARVWMGALGAECRRETKLGTRVQSA